MNVWIVILSALVCLEASLSLKEARVVTRLARRVEALENRPRA